MNYAPTGARGFEISRMHLKGGNGCKSHKYCDTKLSLHSFDFMWN